MGSFCIRNPVSRLLHDITILFSVVPGKPRSSSRSHNDVSIDSAVCLSNANFELRFWLHLKKLSSLMRQGLVLNIG